MKQRECPQKQTRAGGQLVLPFLVVSQVQMAVDADMEVGMKMGAIKSAPYYSYVLLLHDPALINQED